MYNKRYFLDTPVNIEKNKNLRTPQLLAYLAIEQFFKENAEGEALVVLPTGTGKSGLISIAPFGVSNGRVLIITPGLVTKDSISKAQASVYDNFLMKHEVLFNVHNIPVFAEYETSMDIEDMKQLDIINANIQKLEAGKSSITSKVPPDFFDLIIVDESHHAPAATWKKILSYFRNAKKLFVTGTPYRGDNQEVPGELIHETSLSEVMRNEYVKWLRCRTKSAHNLHFTYIDELGDVKIAHLKEILKLKEKTWIERSVALSKECSLSVIDESIDNLNQLRLSSPNVPHKILAVGCSIKHAEDIAIWYKEKKLRTIILHSDLSLEDRQKAFRAIEMNECDVVVSVDMLKEGYDHIYLSTLAIFRPYKSLNAFAQVIGRVLRVIPNDEIQDFAIDNNALVVFHNEIGLNELWEYFQIEVNRARKPRVLSNRFEEMEDSFSDDMYEKKNVLYANISTGEEYIHTEDSFLEDIDYHKLFLQKNLEIQQNVEEKFNKIKSTEVIEEDDEDDLKEFLKQKEIKKASKDIDEIMRQKRPRETINKLKRELTDKTENVATNVLSDLDLMLDGTEIAKLFITKNILKVKNLTMTTTNEASIIIYINCQLAHMYGPKEKRSIDDLIKSIHETNNVAQKLADMLKDIKNVT